MPWQPESLFACPDLAGPSDYDTASPTAFILFSFIRCLLLSRHALSPQYDIKAGMILWCIGISDVLSDVLMLSPSAAEEAFDKTRGPCRLRFPDTGPTSATFGSLSGAEMMA
jgi:hypothetical protein